MKLPLRRRLGLLWGLIVVTCVSLGISMWGMYRQGARNQIEALPGMVATLASSSPPTTAHDIVATLRRTPAPVMPLDARCRIHPAFTEP